MSDFKHDEDEHFAEENRARLRDDLEWLDNERLKFIHAISDVSARYAVAVKERFAGELRYGGIEGFLKDMVGVAADESLTMFYSGRLDRLKRDVGL